MVTRRAGRAIMLFGALHSLGLSILADIGNPVKEIQCVVYDYKRMVCRWKPPGDDLSVNLVWTRDPGTRPNWYQCPVSANNSCEWIQANNRDDLMLAVTYRVSLRLQHKNSSSDPYYTPVYRIEPSAIVKPSRVRKVTVDSVNSTCLSVSWTSESPAYPKLYTVQILRENHSVQINETNETNITVCGLRPYTNYKVNITCVPADKTGFRSEAVIHSHITLIGVPSGPPGLTPGGYWQKPCDSQFNREIIVYIQPVEKDLRNGPHIRYTVSSTSRFKYVKKPSWGDNYVQLEVDCNENYNLSIYGETESGRSSHSASLRLQPSNIVSSTRLDSLLVEIDVTGSVVNVSWREPVERPHQYTVYFCRGLKRDYICQNAITWYHVPANVTNLSLKFDGKNNLELTEETLFGISADFIDRSDGIFWSNCSYLMNSELPSPKELRLMASAKQTVQAEWEPHPCYPSHPYVTHYVVKYCQTTPGGNCAEYSEVRTAGRSIVLKELKGKATYAVSVTGFSRSEKGQRSEWNYIYVEENGLTVGAIVAIIIGTSVLLCFSLFGLVVCIRWTRDVFIRIGEINYVDPPPLPSFITDELDVRGDSVMVDGDASASDILDDRLVKQGFALTQLSDKKSLQERAQGITKGVKKTDSYVQREDNKDDAVKGEDNQTAILRTKGYRRMASLRNLGSANWDNDSFCGSSSRGLEPDGALIQNSNDTDISLDSIVIQPGLSDDSNSRTSPSGLSPLGEELIVPDTGDYVRYDPPKIYFNKDDAHGARLVENQNTNNCNLRCATEYETSEHFLDSQLTDLYEDEKLGKFFVSERRSVDSVASDTVNCFLKSKRLDHSLRIESNGCYRGTEKQNELSVSDTMGHLNSSQCVNSSNGDGDKCCLVHNETPVGICITNLNGYVSTEALLHIQRNRNNISSPGTEFASGISAPVKYG